MNRQHHIILMAVSLFACSFGIPARIVVNAADYDIQVTDRAVVQRCVTSGEARNISVGMPGGFNFAFDPIRCRLDYVWYGGFLDYRGETVGRGGFKVNVLGAKRTVGTASIPLRIGDADREPKTIQFDGYRKEPAAGIPTFIFRVDGVSVEQRVISFGPDQVAIELSFSEADKSPRFYLMDPQAVESVELSEPLEMSGDGVIKIPADETWAQVRVKLKPSKDKFVRREPTTDGRLLYALHCMSCHTLDGKKKIGPSFADLWTKNRTVTRGQRTETITADEPYVRESILDPQAAIVQGYEKANKMIDIRQTLDEKQIDALIKFLMDMKPAE